jgi:hypothetical protein
MESGILWVVVPYLKRTIAIAYADNLGIFLTTM